MNTQWDALMDECIEVCSERDAKPYFKAVESLAKVLDLTCDTGKEFDATEAYKIWCRTEDDVDKSIAEIQRTYGDKVDDFPEIGLKYFGHDRILAVGVYDRGNFDVVAGWEFRKAQPLELQHDRYAKKPYTDESTRIPSSCGAD